MERERKRGGDYLAAVSHGIKCGSDSWIINKHINL